MSDLARLDLLMRSLGYNTLVNDMKDYRTKRHAVDWLVQMIGQRWRLPLRDPAPHLRIAHVSAKIRIILAKEPTCRAFS